MADIDYPTELPLPINRDIQFSEGVSSLSIDLAKGAPVIEKFTDDQQVFYSLSWIMKEQELRMLNGFYDLILNKGTEWFNLSLQWRGSNSAFVTTQEVNFSGNTFKVSNIGKLRQITAGVIVRTPTRS